MHIKIITKQKLIKKKKKKKNSAIQTGGKFLCKGTTGGISDKLFHCVQ